MTGARRAGGTEAGSGRPWGWGSARSVARGVITGPRGWGNWGDVRMHGYITRLVRLLAVPLLLAGAAAGIAPAAPAVAAPAESVGTPTYVHNQLNGVAATSASNAWAVGCTHCFTSNGRALIEHWNGTGWQQVPSPAPAGGVLSGVAATSASNAWAVGENYSSTSSKTLILHWNGTAWKQVPSPSP